MKFVRSDFDDSQGGFIDTGSVLLKQGPDIVGWAFSMKNDDGDDDEDFILILEPASTVDAGRTFASFKRKESTRLVKYKKVEETDPPVPVTRASFYALIRAMQTGARVEARVVSWTDRHAPPPPNKQGETQGSYNSANATFYLEKPVDDRATVHCLRKKKDGNPLDTYIEDDPIQTTSRAWYDHHNSTFGAGRRDLTGLLDTYTDKPVNQNFKPFPLPEPDSQ